MGNAGLPAKAHSTCAALKKLLVRVAAGQLLIAIRSCRLDKSILLARGGATQACARAAARAHKSAAHRRSLSQASSLVLQVYMQPTCTFTCVNPYSRIKAALSVSEVLASSCEERASSRSRPHRDTKHKPFARHSHGARRAAPVGAGEADWNGEICFRLRGTDARGRRGRSR